MTTLRPSTKLFRAAPIVANQFFLCAEKPEAPASYALKQIGGFWLAHDPAIPVVAVRDAKGRAFGHLIGHVYSEFLKDYVDGETTDFPVEVAALDDVELRIMPRLAGMYVLLTGGELAPRVYMDHGGSFPLVYSPSDRRAASSVALLLTEQDYKSRFRADIYDEMIGREEGGWISGTLTAHEGVTRVLPNYYLDLATWTDHRFWPRPGDFATWRDFDASVETAAVALDEFAQATSKRFKIAATLTAGFNSRLLLATCHNSTDRIEFFTIDGSSEMDTVVSGEIAERYGLKHRVLPLLGATDEEAAIWDRMVGDCMMEATRQGHTSLRQLTAQNAVFTGMYGEVGRCRIYRQDADTINSARIDARFIVDRLTLPASPALIDSVEVWLQRLAGQPNSVILDLAFHELKFGNWAMGQRPISNSIKLNFLPFSQRIVFEAFIGVAPAEKGTARLFEAIIERLWPGLMAMPINKFGDYRDHLAFLKKFTKLHRIRRYLRDRFAKAR